MAKQPLKTNKDATQASKSLGHGGLQGALGEVPPSASCSWLPDSLIQSQASGRKAVCGSMCRYTFPEGFPRHDLGNKGEAHLHVVADSVALRVREQAPRDGEPAMQDIMKQAKIIPCATFSPLGLSAGVHRNTKVYMLASNSDCMAPSSAILRSAQSGQRECCC